MSISNKDYLNELIAKAKKSWEGVDVDSYMSDLRDNDMKTIEERAWEKYPEVIKHHNLAHIDINEEKRKMYIDIATEQKAIDDAEYVNKVLMGKGSSINYYKQGYHDAIDKVCEWLRARNVITKDTLIGFRKAMEE